MGHPKQPGQDADAHRAVTEQALALTKENKRLRAALAEAERGRNRLANAWTIMREEFAEWRDDEEGAHDAIRRLRARVASLESENRGLREERDFAVAGSKRQQEHLGQDLEENVRVLGSMMRDRDEARSRCEALEEIIDRVGCEFSKHPRDWSRDNRDAWAYGLVVGWGDAFEEVAGRHGWSFEDRENHRRLRRALSGGPAETEPDLPKAVCGYTIQPGTFCQLNYGHDGQHYEGDTAAPTETGAGEA